MLRYPFLGWTHVHHAPVSHRTGHPGMDVQHHYLQLPLGEITLTVRLHGGLILYDACWKDVYNTYHRAQQLAVMTCGPVSSLKI